jgi:uncharacterized protein YdhG (YjbR/CyaY superfamily)
MKVTLPGRSLWNPLNRLQTGLPVQSKADTVDQYLAALPEDRRNALTTLRAVLKTHLPDGFVEAMQYGMPSFVVPLTRYPSGYHVGPGRPLPFISIASQRQHIALYHMGVYAVPEVLAWFQAEAPKHMKRKLDMGKSCIRFRRADDIPFDVIGQLAEKISVEDWIAIYESAVRR